MTAAGDFVEVMMSVTLQLFAVVHVCVPRQLRDKPRDVSLTDPTPASVPGHSVLLALLLPHLDEEHTK